MFIKTTFKDPNKVKRIRNYMLKCNLYLYSGEKILILAELKGCVTWFINFFNHLKVRYQVYQGIKQDVKLYHCRICVTDFREGSLFVSSFLCSPKKVHPEQG